MQVYIQYIYMICCFKNIYIIQYVALDNNLLWEFNVFIDFNMLSYSGLPCN